MLYSYTLKVLHNYFFGSYTTKAVATVQISATTAVGLTLFERFSAWYMSNQVFMIYVFIALMIDHLLGTYVHLFIKRDFTIQQNLEGLLKKGFAIVAGYILFEMIHQIVQEVDFISIYFKVLLHIMVILYPAGSAMVNLSIITDGVFPPIGWMRKLKNFNENVNLHEFSTKKDVSNESYEEPNSIDNTE